jgi:hypothetical protein
MANYLITNYAKWQKLSEAQSPGKTKQTAGMGQRVVGIPVNQQSFKIKLIGDLDVIDNTGKLTIPGWSGLLNWIKQQPKWLPYYPGLGDLKTNFVIYSINKDTNRKQLITFTIMPRTSAPGLPEATQIVKKEDLATVISDAAKAKELTAASTTAVNTQVDTKTPAAQTSQIKLARSLTFEQLKGVSSNQPVFTAFKNAYLNMWKKPEFADLAVMSKLKDELRKETLGDAAVLLAKGVIAGFNLVDEYEDLIDKVDQQVVDKLALFAPQTTAQNSSRKYFLGLGATAVYEQSIVSTQDAHSASDTPATQDKTTGLPTGFDLDAFIVAVEQGATSSEQALGDIKLPEGGFKKGSVAKGDSELKKFQQLVIDKFAKKLAGNTLYKKFAKFGADGSYGPTTEKMVAALKSALGCSDKDGKTITAELITKINTNKIDEGVYLGLNSRLVEQFDMGAYEETSKTYTAAPAKKATSKTKDTKKEKDDTKAPSGNAKKASDLLKKASETIQAYYKNSSNFEEFKGTWNDDEEAAVKEIFGKNYDDTDSWFYRVIRLNYLKPADKLIKSVPDEDPNSSLLNKELKKIQGLYGILKKKTLGDTANDSYTWSHIDLDNKKTSFKVDTDF